MPPNHAVSSFLLLPPFTLPELELNIKVFLDHKTAGCTQLKLEKKNPNKRQLDHCNGDSQLGNSQHLKHNNLHSYN